MKCMYGCSSYGKKANCPPNNPSIELCERIIHEYKEAVVFHFQKKFENPDQDEIRAWMNQIKLRLLNLERNFFLAGHVKTFLLTFGICNLCKECTSKCENCNHPKKARPTPEGMVIDVYSTVRRIGYPIEVLKDYSEKMNRYAFLIIK